MKESETFSESRRIDKIFFLIHPVCWAAGFPDQKLASHIIREDEFYANYKLEKKVRKKQDAFIAGLKENEALIIHPIGEGREMRELEAFAEKILGDRCIILRRQPPKLSDYKHYLPDEILADLSREVMQAYVEFNYSWLSSSIKVLYTNRAYARDIQNELKERGLFVDPGIVEAEAFGEGFEGCAMTWKGMVAHYLGWEKPIENRYELSVSGAPFLIHAEFKERIALKDDVRLFLWVSSHGRPIGFYARAGFKMKDHQRFARFACRDLHLEIWNVAMEQKWPVNGSKSLSVWPEEGSLNIAVYEGGRKLHTDDALYIFGRTTMAYEDFKAILLNADILAV